MQEILPLVLNGGDLTPIQTIPNWDRAPWLEEKRLALVVDQLTSPRPMVTHFPYQLMPPSFHTSKAKVNGCGAFVCLCLISYLTSNAHPTCVCLPAAGDLCDEEPQGCHGVLLLLPPDGWIPGGSRNIWRVHGEILGGQRSEVTSYSFTLESV